MNFMIRNTYKTIFYRQERLAAVAEMKKQKRRQKNAGRHQQTTGEPLINKRML